MSATGTRPEVTLQDVRRLWFARQGLSQPRGTTAFGKRAFVDHLERTGALQVDSVNVVDRAHYLTLWSRFGAYDRTRVDRWIYRDRAAYEYWGHEASILPMAHLPVSRRRMRRFPPESWRKSAWWERFETPLASKRRVLRRIRDEGPLESIDFERRKNEQQPNVPGTWAGVYPKEDKRTLKRLWHDGRLAVAKRKHFRCVYDLADRVYPGGGAQPDDGVSPFDIASKTQFEDSWLLAALSGNGIVSERHAFKYFTSPELKAAERRRVLARNLKKGTIVEVAIRDAPELPGPWYARPGDLERLAELPEPEGTNLLCPFDSFLWQRQRAADLLDFHYRIEIYVPAAKRQYGYYVLPILHGGRLVGRLDPKLHRDRDELEIKSLHWEPGIRPDSKLRQGLVGALEDLGEFLGARKVTACI